MKNIFKTISEKIEKIEQLREKHREKKNKQISVSLHKSEEKIQKIEFDISVITIIKILFIIAIFFTIGELFVKLQSIIIIAAICFFLAMGISPIVDNLEKRKIPRPMAIFILYLIFFGGLGILFVEIVPILASQLLSIARDLRDYFADGEIQIPYLHNMLKTFQVDPTSIETFIAENLTTISKNLQSVAGSTFSILSGVFQGVFNFIFALVLLFFILMEQKQIGNFILALIPKKDQKYVIEKIETIQSKMSDWFRGQIILMISMGIFMYLGMKIFEFIFGMQYAATIGLMAAFMELFPYIGVLLTGILAGLIAVNISWILLISVIAWIALAQFLEGNFLVPIVMEKVTGLSSVVVMLALAMGGVLGNAIGGVPLAILGMILAIPIAASIGIFVEEFAKKEY